MTLIIIPWTIEIRVGFSDAMQFNGMGKALDKMVWAARRTILLGYTGWRRNIRNLE